MAKIGPNGTVLAADTSPARDYLADHDRPRVRRVLLATFLCGICASISVTMIAAGLAFSFSSATALFGATPFEMGERDEFMSGAIMAVMMAGFNWIVFYVVLPVTWVALALSIGMFPRRGIVRSRPYYRWGAIWGALLVGTPTAIFGISGGAATLVGALVTGLSIGLLAGLVCAALFLAIVRPRQQVSQITADVF